MNKKTFKGIMLLITYFILLVAIVVKIDMVLNFFSKILFIFTPLFIGIAIAFILCRPYEFFFRNYNKLFNKGKLKKLSKPLAILTSYAIFLGIIIGIIIFIIPQLSDSIKLLYSNLGEFGNIIESFILRMNNYFKIDNLDLSRFDATIEKIPDFIGGFLSGLMPRIFDVSMSFVTMLINIILGLVLSVYLLADKGRLKRQFKDILRAYIPTRFEHKVLKVARVTNDIFTRFVYGQMTEALILGTLCFTGMLIFGFDYPILISIIIAVSSLIPVVGPIIGLLPALFILLMVDPMQSLWFLVFIIVLQQIEGDFIYPKVVGDSIGLPALWVLVAIVVGGGLFGVLGILLGVPILSVIYRLLKEDVNARILTK